MKLYCWCLLEWGIVSASLMLWHRCVLRTQGKVDRSLELKRCLSPAQSFSSFLLNLDSNKEELLVFPWIPLGQYLCWRSPLKLANGLEIIKPYLDSNTLLDLVDVIFLHLALWLSDLQNSGKRSRRVISDRDDHVHQCRLIMKVPSSSLPLSLIFLIIFHLPVKI